MAAIFLGAFRPRRRVLGMDVAGVVEAVGADVTRFAPGDEVIAMLGARFGGHAEYVCVPQDGAITAKPRNLTFEEAVTFVFGGITARAYLNQVTLRPGATVLVNGASDAVGTAAVQLAKQAGAHVTGRLQRRQPGAGDLARTAVRELAEWRATPLALAQITSALADRLRDAPAVSEGPVAGP